MKLEEEISERFKSGNDIPVESARITKEEWEAIQAELTNLRAYKWLYEGLCK